MNLYCLVSLRAVLLAALFLVLSVSVPAVPGSASELLQGTMLLAPVSERNVVAANAAEDTLAACLGRIPLNATVEQRLLAETTCADEEAARKQSPPNF